MKAKFDDPTIRNLPQAESAYECMAEKEPGFGIRVYTSTPQATLRLHLRILQLPDG